MESASSIGSKAGPSRLQPVDTVSSPEQPTPGSIRSQMSFADPTHSKKKSSITSVLKGLETKSKPELLAIAKKMVQEISVKNRIIHESNQNEKWMAAELALQSKISPSKRSGMSTLQLEMSKITASELDKDLIQTMMNFKEELTKAKQALEQVLVVNVA
jgi:hypothetical protein